MMVSEFVQKAAPEGAKYYRLKLNFTDGTDRYYPAPSSEGYLVGQAPVGAPLGTYGVCFYDAAGHPVAHHESVSVDLSLESARVGTAQMGLSLSNASGPPRSSAPAAPSVSERPIPEKAEAERRPVTALFQSGPSPSSLSPETEAEFRRLQHAMDVEERQQEFIKNSTYVTEIGELFELNRVMRREMVEMQRVIVHQSQQAHKDLDLMKSTLRDLFKLQQEALDKAAALIPRPPPPPPPDYVGLGHTALGVLREIGVALIDNHRSRGGESSAPLRSSKTPQLPAANGGAHDAAKDPKEAPVPNAEKEEATSAEGTPPSSLMDRLLHKLKTANELELALAMSSPSSWKAFMDGLLVTPPSSEKGDAPRPAASVEGQNPADAAAKRPESV